MSYHAPAVHFDGNTDLVRTASLVGVADSGLISYSLWTNADSFPGLPADLWYFFDIDPPLIEAGPQLRNNGSVRSFWGSTGNQPNNTPGIPGSYTISTWHHVFGYADSNQAFGSQIVKMFIDAVDVTGVVNQNGVASVMPFSSVGWAIPDSADNFAPPWFTGCYADVWIAPGVMETDITIFRDPITGAPKDPAGFPASAILFSGNAATFGNNQGTGGAFVLNNPLTDCASSPSPPGGPSYNYGGSSRVNLRNIRSSAAYRQSVQARGMELAERWKV